MRTSALALAAGLLALGTAAWAADNSGSGASGSSPGHDAKHQDGKMQGSPNAAGFGKEGDKAGSTGSTGADKNSTRPGGGADAPGKH